MVNASSLQDQLFKALNITDIVWVDDWFAKNQTTDELIDVIIRELTLLQEMGELIKFNHFLLKDVDFTVDQEIWADQLRSVTFPGASTNDLSGLFEVLTSQDGDDKIIDDITPVLNDSVVNLKPLSLSEWEAQKVTLLTSADQTLFLVDLNFSKEGMASDHGKEIIKEILSEDSGCACCILFTHTCAQGDDEERLRTDIFREFNADCPSVLAQPYMFSVLSKKEFSTDNINQSLEQHLPRVLQAKFMRKICSHIACGLKENIHSSVDEVLNHLASTNIYQVDNSIFQSVLKEGSSEIDLMFRLFQIAQRTSVTNLLKDQPNISFELKKLRELQQLTEAPTSNTPNDFFVGLRHKEIWDDDSINSYCSPLQNGDVFSYEDKKFILLGQPCDLMVRGDKGDRNPFEGTLFLLEERQGAVAKSLKKAKDDDSVYCIQELDGKNDYTKILLTKAIHVNLNILDWCVFNTSGQVSLSFDPNLDPIVFLPGWVKKFDGLRQQLTSQSDQAEDDKDDCELPASMRRMTNSYKPFGADTINFDPKANMENKKWDTGLRRTGRLRDPYAEHALLKYFSYKSRKAFERDFN